MCLALVSKTCRCTYDFCTVSYEVCVHLESWARDCTCQRSNRVLTSRGYFCRQQSIPSRRGMSAGNTPQLCAGCYNRSIGTRISFDCSALNSQKWMNTGPERLFNVTCSIVRKYQVTTTWVCVLVGPPMTAFTGNRWEVAVRILFLAELLLDIDISSSFHPQNFVLQVWSEKLW